MLIDSFLSEGFALLSNVFSQKECETVSDQILPCDQIFGGTRNLLQFSWCISFVNRLRGHKDLCGFLPPDLVAVQCSYFEKSVEHNWLVPIHQDLSIPVAHKVDHPELQGWSEKEGILFVQAPTTILESMLSVRIHLDDCRDEDGPTELIHGLKWQLAV